MDGNEQAALEAAMTALIARLVADTRLEAERQRARRTFFGQSEDGTRRRIDAAAERRFYEWFALERESETLGEVPVTVDKYDAGDELTGSMVGAFVVTAVNPEWVTARDLQDGAMLEFRVPKDSLAEGDLVVGRLFGVGVGQWLPSSAASVFRPGAALAEAFARDVGGLGLDRRLLQIELEHTLLLPHAEGRLGAEAAEPSAPLEHLEADLDRLLRGQDAEYSATAISAELAAADRPGAVIGPLLERIAFETAADLDAVRRVLLEIWNVQHAGSASRPEAEAPPREGPPGETLGERMVRRLDEGLGKKQDLEGLFAELEAMAGLEPGASDDGENPFDREGEPEAAADAGDTAGNLGPLVEEFLWETGAQEGDVPATLRLWVELQGNAPVPRTDVEEVTGVDLMRVLLHVFLAAGPEQRGAAVRGAFDALREFGNWIASTHEIDLGDSLKACDGALLDQVDRLAAASAGLSTTEASRFGPAMFEIEEVGPKGFGMRDDAGSGYWLDVPASVCARLRAGDLLLGAVSEGRRFAGPVVVLPAEARSLME